MADNMDQDNNIIVGIVGGGTGCRVAIATRAGKIIGSGRAGPANPTFSPKKALENVQAAIEMARKDAALDSTDMSRASAFAGLAGVRDDKTAAYISAGLPFDKIQVVEDRVTSVMGALAGQNGSVAPIGTGSFLARRTDAGTQYLGGWGFFLGDDASGAWLGHQLLRQVILSVEGIEKHTDLTRDLLAQYGDDAANIFEFCKSATPADFGKFAPQVVDGAQNGDDVATGLMQSGAKYISKALTALGFQSGEPLCLTGGVGPHYAEYLPPQFNKALIKPKGTALDGALLLAAKQ